MLSGLQVIEYPFTLFLPSVDVLCWRGEKHQVQTIRASLLPLALELGLLLDCLDSDGVLMWRKCLCYRLG